MKEYMSFIGGMLEGRSRPIAPGSMKFLDFEKAEQICLSHPDSTVVAGLMEDWGYTSGIIFKDGKWYDGGVLYAQSFWATPIVDVDGEEIECWTHVPTVETGVPKWWGRGETVGKALRLTP